MKRLIGNMALLSVLLRCLLNALQPLLALSANSDATRWRCFLSAVTTWVITSHTGWRWARTPMPANFRRYFYVNWFRKDAEGGWLWPGFGENSRVLKWIVERVAGNGEAVETPIGYLPASGAIDTTGLDVTDAQMEELLNVDVEEWLNEIESIREHYARFEETLPQALSDELAALEARLREQQ